jgi:mannose-6-phosphate isomerase
MKVVALDGVIRRYAWGSTSVIQNLLGLPVDGTPAAELWFGAHPDDPSPVPVHGSSLDEVIDADPVAALGADVVAQFGGRLPFLMKLLAANTPLSLQVHPDLEQARAGFAAENAAGVPPDARERNYHDPNHKPELLCALTEFEALCGFRPVPETLALLHELALPELDFLRSALTGPDPLRAAFTALLTQAERDAAVEAVSGRATPDGPLRPAYLAAQHFPGDVGIVIALLLNYVRLTPGEAIYLGAGNVHSYLSGTGVEIMANSDNVLRCGLTPKHVAVSEVLAITDFRDLAEPRVSADAGGFRVPVPDFRLGLVDVSGPVSISQFGPRIVLCSAGSVSVADVSLTPGRAAFVPAALGSVDVTGAGRIFVGAVYERSAQRTALITYEMPPLS